MLLEDARGSRASGATPEALAAYEAGLAQFQCYAGNPVAEAEKAIALAPDFAMGHLLLAQLCLSGLEAAGSAAARAPLAAAAKLASTEREKLHLAAGNAWADGRFEAASEMLEDILLHDPRDALALQMGHILDFARGDSRNLRDRVVRVLPAWSKSLPGYHAVQGMLSFGLEECGEYDAAEAAGRLACMLEPCDAWAHHAVAHVLEMRGDAEGGISWMRERENHWAPDNMFAVHNWWHLALYHLERDDMREVLRLYDERIRAGKSAVVLDMIDASALLWRLWLRGHDAGSERWAEIAATWAPLSADGFLAFNDLHGLMAFLGAGRQDLVQQQIATLRRAALGPASNAAMSAQVGLPAAEGFAAFAAGAYERCVELLRPIRGITARFGGSHAQRDLIDLTLIEAARRAGQSSLVRALAAERLRRKPQSPLAIRYALQQAA